MSLASERAVRRVLVTGGAGFLGLHLCRQLLDDGVEVVSVDDLCTSAPDAVDRLRDRAGFRLLRHDISDPACAAAVGTGYDTVFHLACPASPADYQRLPLATLRVGAAGTATALEIAERSDARVVLASTSEVYGDPLCHPQVETYWGNVNPIGVRSVYDEAKRYAEALVFAHWRERRTDIGVARIFNTYGPGMRAGDGRMVPTFCVQALRGEPLTVAGTGAQTRSLCHVSDTVAGLIALARSDFTGPVNLGNPVEITVAAVADLIRDLAGTGAAIRYVPSAVDDPRRRCPDIAVARERLGWQPRVELRAGLADTLAWFRRELAEAAVPAGRGRREPVTRSPARRAR